MRTGAASANRTRSYAGLLTLYNVVRVALMLAAFLLLSYSSDLSVLLLFGAVLGELFLMRGGVVVAFAGALALVRVAVALCLSEVSCVWDASRGGTIRRSRRGEAVSATATATATATGTGSHSMGTPRRVSLST